MLKERLKYFWYSIARFICRVFCAIFFKLRVCGAENIPKEGAFLLVSNHQSFLDPLFCGVRIKRHLNFLARDSLFKIFFFGRLIFSVNAIPVKRGAADLSAMRTVIAKLRSGKGVCLFPEGTRTFDGRIAEFKPGLGLLCRRGEAAVVPAVVDGAFEAWPRHKKLFSPGRKIVVCFGPAITAEQIAQMDDRQLAEKLTSLLREMQNDCRKNQGKEPYEY
jgi:1-acyl-sn-glycerol-3-phosphate acyltransferase